MSVRSFFKLAGNLVALTLTAPFGLLCWLEKPTSALVLFRLFGQCFAIAPGLPGMMLRRGFYVWTLKSCSWNCHIGYGTVLNHRGAEISDGAYIGDYALIGHVRIGRDSLIGSRTSLMSGGQQHHLTAEGKWSATSPDSLSTITIHNDVWIGEGAIIMADVGERCMVSAGAVVAAPIKNGIMVAGNPARFVRNLELPPPAPAVEPMAGIAQGRA